jgi:hypothetical protein
MSVVVPVDNRKANKAFDGLYEETWQSKMGEESGRSAWSYKPKSARYKSGFFGEEYSIHLDGKRLNKDVQEVTVSVQRVRQGGSSATVGFHVFRQGVHITPKYLKQCFSNMYGDDHALLHPIINYLVLNY